MTTKDGVVNFEYKEGVSDTVGLVLKQNGTPIDLTGYSIVFNMKNDLGTVFTVPCSLGGTKDGVQYTAAQGGCTIEFAAGQTSVIGEYSGELVGTLNGIVSFIIPNGDEYFIVMIYEAIVGVV